MMNDIRIMLREINKLTGKNLSLFHYTGAKRPYGIMDDRSQELFRSNIAGIYSYLDGILKGIELYRSYLQDGQGIDIDMLLESLNQSTDE